MSRSDDPNEKMYEPRKLFETKDMLTTIGDIRFSPDDRFLAVGSHDRCVALEFVCYVVRRTMF